MRGMRLLIIGILCVLGMAGFTFAQEGTLEYNYNAEGELKRVETPAGQAISAYEYDASGNMVSVHADGLALRILNATNCVKTSDVANFQIIDERSTNAVYDYQISSDGMQWATGDSLGSTKQFSIARSTNCDLYVRVVAQGSGKVRSSLPVKVQFHKPLRLEDVSIRTINGATISIHAQAEGRDVEYRFLNDEANEGVLSDFTSTATHTYQYTGKLDEWITFTVEVRDPFTQGVIKKQITHKMIVEPQWTVSAQTGVNHLTTTKVRCNDNVNIRVDNDALLAGYTYRLEVQENGGSWTAVTAFSSNTNYQITRSNETDLRLRIVGRKNGVVYKPAKPCYLQFYPKIAVNGFTKTVGSKPYILEFEVDAVGRDIRYTLYKRISGGNWVAIAGPQSENSFTYRLKGWYNETAEFQVRLSDDIKYESATTNVLQHVFNIKPLDLRGVEVDVNTLYPQVGTGKPVKFMRITANATAADFATFTCKIITGKGEKEYAYTVQPNEVFTFQPEYDDTYKIEIIGSDGITEPKTVIEYCKIVDVQEAFQITDFWVSGPSATDDRNERRILVNAKYDINAVYAFYYEKLGGDGEHLIRGYSSSSLTYWTPPSDGSYHVTVRAKDDYTPIPIGRSKAISVTLIDHEVGDDSGGSIGGGSGGGEITRPGFPGGGDDLAF